MASTLDFFLNLHLAALRGVERREGGSGGRRRRIVDEIMQENMICFWLLHAAIWFSIGPSKDISAFTHSNHQEQRRWQWRWQFKPFAIFRISTNIFKKCCLRPGSRLFVRNCMTSGSHFLFQLFLR